MRWSSFRSRVRSRRPWTGVLYALAGRPSVWAGPSDFVYAPPGSAMVVSSEARRQVRRRDGAGRAEVPGAATWLRRLSASSFEAPALRPVRSGTSPLPDDFEADRLIAVEVLTPGGNWGSYPPHKHDEVRAGETDLEEIYHYVVADGPSARVSRTSTSTGRRTARSTSSRPSVPATSS